MGRIIATVGELDRLEVGTVLKFDTELLYQVFMVPTFGGYDEDRMFMLFGTSSPVTSEQVSLPVEVISEPRHKQTSSFGANREKGFEELISELEQVCDDSDSVQYGTVSTSFVRDYSQRLKAARNREDGKNTVDQEQVREVIARSYQEWAEVERNQSNFLNQVSDEVLALLP